MVTSRAPTPVEIDAERCRRSLSRFMREAWSIVETNPYQHNWHIEHVCAHLEAVTAGKIRNLIINIPPGSTKSLLVSVFWNAWHWINDPSEAFLYSSFDSALTLRDAEKVRNLMSSKWFLERWGYRVRLDLNDAAGDFNTLGPNGQPLGGWRFSTSVAGKTTGRHPGVRCIDDPTKPLEATRENLDKTWFWWQSTMKSRQRNPATVATVLIMQRLAEDDLAGKFLEEEKPEGEEWYHVRIPLMYDGNPYRTKLVNKETGEPYTDPRTVEGESFFPERFTAVVCEGIKIGTPDIGVWSSQYQQDPTPPSGIIFTSTHFSHRYTQLPETGTWTLSVDATFADGEKADFVVMGVWIHDPPNFYLVDLVRERMDFTATIQRLKDLLNKWPKCYEKLIEKKANGPAIISHLVNVERMSGVVPWDPGRDSKETRARATVPMWTAGNVLLPETAPYVHEYVAEHIKFPRGKNDDQVDMTSQYLIHTAGKGGLDYGAAMDNARRMGLL